MPKKASIWEMKGGIFVSSEIRQMMGNLYKCKRSETDTSRRGCKHNVSSKFFPFESVKAYQRIHLAQKKHEMKRSKSKRGKKIRIFQFDGK